jgi:hypothetical protein
MIITNINATDLRTINFINKIYNMSTNYSIKLQDNIEIDKLIIKQLLYAKLNESNTPQISLLTTPIKLESSKIYKLLSTNLIIPDNPLSLIGKVYDDDMKDCILRGIGIFTEYNLLRIKYYILNDIYNFFDIFILLYLSIEDQDIKTNDIHKKYIEIKNDSNTKHEGYGDIYVPYPINMSTYTIEDVSNINEYLTVKFKKLYINQQMPSNIYLKLLKIINIILHNNITHIKNTINIIIYINSFNIFAKWFFELDDDIIIS